jgi:acetyl-CoA carboxylase biotin carboxyl carrier protein
MCEGEEDYLMALMNKDEIIQILKLVAESAVDEFHLESGGLKLSIKKHSRGESAPLRKATPEEFEKATAEQAERPALSSASSMSPVAEMPAQREPAPSLPEEDGLIAIRAPMLGTFYRAPKPEAPPFVEVGQFVTEEDVVCIIEVMKLFNTVKAGVRGRIAKICAENAQLVEYKQALFLVEEPAEDKTKEEQAS